MKVTDTKITDVKVIEPTVFEDERGFFFESFNHKKFEEAIDRSVTLVQHNQSKSSKNVLRGLHYQLQPHAQGKLVSVVHGEVFDVVVDIRKSSPTFGQWVADTLSAENKKQLWIPEGFAHGFLSLEHNTIVTYGLSEYYHPPSERVILWNDELLNITWPLEGEPILSARDSNSAEPFQHYCDMWGVKAASGVN